MEKNQFDEIDEKILQMLAEDGRRPFQEVARECGVSGTTIHARVKRLMSSGAILGSKYIIDPGKIGYDTCAYICFRVSDETRTDSIIEALSRIPEVVEVHSTDEEYDLLVKVYAKNNSHLHTLLKTVFKPLGLVHSKIMISFRTLHRKQLSILPDNNLE